MRRSWSAVLSRKALDHLRYVPSVVAGVRNWAGFLATYAGVSKAHPTLRLRDGMVVHTGSTDDVSTVMVVFFKKEYGDLRDVPEGATIVDIGANIGAFSLLAARAVKGSTIYAFEPMAKLHEVLCRNLEANGLEGRIEPARQGVWSTTGSLELFLSATSTSSHSVYQGGRTGGAVSIDVISLADAFERHQIARCDLLKMDCEGSEYEILYKAPREVLGRIREIRMEYHQPGPQRDHTFDALRDFLGSHGFAMTHWEAERETTGNAWFRRE